MKEYKMTGMMNGWKIVSEEIKARTDRSAKKKMRRLYKGIQSLMVVGIRKVEEVQ